MAAESEPRRIDLFAMIAFALLVVACYLPFVTADRLDATPAQIVATFALAAVYTVLVGVGSDWCNRWQPGGPLVYLLVQCALLTAMVIISPQRGIFGIIVLPIVSHAIFVLPWPGAAVVIVYLFGLVVGAVGWTYGLKAAGHTALGYAAAFAFTIVFTAIGLRAIRAQAHAERLRGELETANEQLRRHAAEAEKLATIEERNRLAREIHDGVGHYLTVIKVQLDAATALLPTDPARAADSVAKAARLAGEALDDVRRSVGALAADSTRPPLVDALRQLASHAAPAPVLRIEGTPRALGAAAEHALYRTAQEGLTNVRKHAAATEAELTLDFSAPHRVRLTLADNGRGPAAPAAAPGANGGGQGLRGLRERLALLGGTLTAAHRPEGGFVLTAEVLA